MTASVRVLATHRVGKLLGFGVSVDFLKRIGCKPVLVSEIGSFWNAGGINEIRSRIILELERQNALENGAAADSYPVNPV